MLELDSFDLKLLSAVQKNNNLTAAQLSEIVHLSPASCLRRLKRLRDHKVIVKDVAIADPAKLGLRVTIIVAVTLESEQSHISNKFKEDMLKAAEVTQCYYVTGDHDYILVLSVADMSHYERFADKFFFKNPHVKKFNTSVMINKIKFETAIPIDLD